LVWLFANRLGVDPTTLARWEKGKDTPSKKFQRIITGFLKFRESGSIEVNPNPIVIHRKPLQ
jgi:transcriptional regulator with XRE-family HTH domain